MFHFKGRSKLKVLFISTIIISIWFFLSQKDSYNSHIDSITEKSSNYLNKFSNNNNTNNNNAASKINSISVDSFLSGNELIHSLFGKYFDLLIENKASYPLKRRMKLDDNGKPYIDDVHFEDNEDKILSENTLLGYFDFPNEFINDLTEKHKNIINNLPNFIPNFYKGSGYAIVGGGKYSWFSFLAVKSLRKIGSNLPIEVILPTSNDYEKLLCETLLPNLNAKCVEMEKVFGKENIGRLNLTGYQLKSLALLASSFKNVFLLDSDSYAVTNPDLIFKSKLYKDYNMITWPDFWRRTTSPLFYKITGNEIPDDIIRHINDEFTNIDLMNLNNFKSSFEIDIKSDYNFHDRKNTLKDFSTESGEMLINKKFHFQTLLLALYYNFDGPYCYHPLLSQGGAGEGDKETFVAAANYFNLPFYQVHKKADRTYGVYNYLNTFEHGAIVQYDPITDYENLEKVKNKIKNDIKIQGSNFKYDYKKYFDDLNKITDSKPMFYHCHDPKFDPFFIMDNKKMFVRVDNKEIDERRRLLGHDFPRTSIDLELSLWEMAEDFICKKEMNFQIFKDKDHLSFCNEKLPPQMKFLRESHDFIVKNYNKNTPSENYAGSNNLSEEMANEKTDS
jgi:alpha 1,2-mannosyltransferase